MCLPEEARSSVHIMWVGGGECEKTTLFMCRTLVGDSQRTKCGVEIYSRKDDVEDDVERGGGSCCESCKNGGGTTWVVCNLPLDEEDTLSNESVGSETTN